MISRNDRPEHIIWPAERFYLTVLDVSDLPRTSFLAPTRSNQQRGYLFEEVLPVPIDDLQVVYVHIDNTYVLACAVDRTILNAEREDHWLTLTPDPRTLVELLSRLLDTSTERADNEHMLDIAQRINLLGGPFEPPVLRHAKRRFQFRLALVVAFIILALIIGLERRRAHNEAIVSKMVDAQAALLQQVYDNGNIQDRATSQPLALRLLGELRQLRRTRARDSHSMGDSTRSLGDGMHSGGAGGDGPDLLRGLESLLAVWPNDLHFQVERITLDASSLTVVAELPTDEAQDATERLAHVHGWRSQIPQTDSRRGLTQVTFRYISRGGEP